MNKCEYSQVFTDAGVEIKKYDDKSWKPLARQCLITSGVCCVYFLQGMFLGAPTVLVAQIRREMNSTEIITDEMLSWLTTAPVISALPFVIILPILFNRIGRKLTFLFVWLMVIIGFIIFYCSTNLYYILISEILAGATSASMITISPVLVAEYTSPQYRGIFLTLKGATGFWGIWISNAIGTFFHWKNIALVSFVCSVHIITVILWPESPYWLAKNGRYDECAKSHRWLKGVNKTSEKELAQLISSQIKSNDPSSGNRINVCSFSRLSVLFSIIKSRSFYKPALISILLMMQYQYTGKVVISMYAIEVLKHLTPDQSFVYIEMLILDGVTVVSMYVGCIISRYFKRKTLLLLFSSTGISVLYILSFYLYLVSLSIVRENDVAILLLLTVFSITIGCGPMILCTSIFGEIMPPRYQNTAMIFVGSCGISTMSLLLKMSPYMFKNFKMHGSFLFFALSSTILLSIIYINLPETKDKTIQEIEGYFAKTEALVKEDMNTTARKKVESNSLI